MPNFRMAGPKVSLNANAAVVGVAGADATVKGRCTQSFKGRYTAHMVALTMIFAEVAFPFAATHAAASSIINIKM